MNTSILNKDVQDFINIHLKSDISKLILKGSPFTDVSIQELATQIEAKQKCINKLPTWFKTEGIYYPNKLNIEQTSSEITAQYKANLITGSMLIDLTGGFGVDCYYFAKPFKQVVHCEINTALSEIASHNFKALKALNITTVAKSGIEYLKDSDVTYDWIYIDPSRRDVNTKKVFFLNQCVPDITQHLDLLFNYSDNILIKLSPLLDITKTLTDLKYVKEIHCVAVKNEMKELLFILEKNCIKKPKIVTINIIYNEFQKYEYQIDKFSNIKYNFISNFIYEPNVAILKSGGFKHLSESFKLLKLHQNTHLFTLDKLIDFPGRRFKVLAIYNFDKKLIKLKFQNTKANITIRNFPLSVSDIRKKFKIRDGGLDYIFFTTNLENKLQVIHCHKV
ncbi:MAG: class I SAM-dependent methyltransferase [Flavobacteriaceae bacterium]